MLPKAGVLELSGKSLANVGNAARASSRLGGVVGGDDTAAVRVIDATFACRCRMCGHGGFGPGSGSLDDAASVTHAPFVPEMDWGRGNHVCIRPASGHGFAADGSKEMLAAVPGNDDRAGICAIGAMDIAGKHSQADALFHRGTMAGFTCRVSIHDHTRAMGGDFVWNQGAGDAHSV